MPNEEHVAIFQRGESAIRSWQQQHPNDWLELAGLNLSRANLRGLKLGKIDFSAADLSVAQLAGADLTEAYFTRANLSGADLTKTILNMASFQRADLTRAQLQEAELVLADLSEANLSETDMRGSNLSGADLIKTNLSRANLHAANLSEVICHSTIFADTDLSEAEGLETVVHHGPSSLGIETMVRSKGTIPEVFLRGCGVPNNLIAAMLGRYRSGERFAGWQLLEKLGQGGNGEVWKARHDDGRQVALKMLRSRDPRDERYKRFVAEVAVLRSLGQMPGILPLIDALLPDLPTRANPAWLATPLAIPLTKAMPSEPSLEEVVRVIEAIATTLTRLHEKGVVHRDIKPDNLFSYQDAWVIGDFGLADFPEKVAITKNGRKLGPQNYLAPEMLFTAGKADGAPADVYSLAKTLWVLATGLPAPPPGEQRTDVADFRIGTYHEHDKATSLDSLMDRATRHSPTDRPKMASFAAELGDWLKKA